MIYAPYICIWIPILPFSSVCNIHIDKNIEKLIIILDTECINKHENSKTRTIVKTKILLLPEDTRVIFHDIYYV
jgi:hypothetical protein